MKSHFFAYISRMRFIQRWALMRNTAPENVQEHSHQVAVLAHALAVIRNERFGGRVDAGAVAAAALDHDASEILTGDMPTPIKYDNPAIRKAYKDVETVAEEMHRSYLEGCVGRTYPVLFEQPKNGKFFGHAPNYMEVLVDGAELHNALRTVRITDVDGEALLGEIVEQEAEA